MGLLGSHNKEAQAASKVQAAPSSIATIVFLDALGGPIKALKYEIRSANKLLASGQTNDKGESKEVSGARGASLEIYVKKFLSDELKQVKTTTFAMASELIVLQSPKIMLEMGLVAHEEERGNYRRQTHTVRKGESLQAIAKLYGCTMEELAQLNNLKDVNKLSIGQILKIPPKASDTPAPASLLKSGTVTFKSGVAAVTKPMEWLAMKGVEGGMALAKLQAAYLARGANGSPQTVVGNLCADKNHCLQQGSPPSDLILELNIRLAGFGGALPTREFTARTEKCVRKFQEHYMGITPTGRVCGNMLRALDEFMDKYNIDKYFGGVPCPCKTYGGKDCSGWGTEGMPHEYNGLHRSVWWALRAAVFYMATKESKLGFALEEISSGYRCTENNNGCNAKQEYRETFNHMGRALDLWFTKQGRHTSETADMNSIRKNIFKDYMGATESRTDAKKEDGHIFLESAEIGAKSWVHFDMTGYTSIPAPFPKEKGRTPHFVRTAKEANGGRMVDAARIAAGDALVLCMGNGSISIPKPTSSGDRVPVDQLSISDKGMAFIVSYEKCRLDYYDDGGKGKGNCTVGYGHLVKKETCESAGYAGKTITKEEALALFKKDLGKINEEIRKNVRVPLYQYEYDALCSLAFNTRGFASFPKLKQKLNAGDYQGAAVEFLDVTKADGQVKSDLETRRKAENNIFLNNVYSNKA